MTDIFGVQDDIVRKTVTTLTLLFNLHNLKVPNIGQSRQPTDNLEAFNDLLQGSGYFWHFTNEANLRARQLFEKAIELDPKYAIAYDHAGWSYLVPVLNQWGQNPQADLKRASEFAEKALALDDSDLGGLTILAEEDVLESRFDQAVTDARHAVALDPNYAASYESLASALIFDGSLKRRCLIYKRPSVSTPSQNPFTWWISDSPTSSWDTIRRRPGCWKNTLVRIRIPLAPTSCFLLPIANSAETGMRERRQQRSCGLTRSTNLYHRGNGFRNC
jgi:tetratricopeptide (TPR) repeat protein